MIQTFIWGLRFYLRRTNTITAIRIAWHHADEPTIVDWFAVILIATILLGLVEVSKG